MDRHTPGEWTVKRLDNNHWIIESSAGGIAKTQIPYGAEKEQIAANAVLLGAAPKFLFALRELLNEIQKSDDLPEGVIKKSDDAMNLIAEVTQTVLDVRPMRDPPEEELES